MAAWETGFPGSPPPRVATLIRRVHLHGLTAEIVGPSVMRRTASLLLAGYPEATMSDATDFTICAKRVKGKPSTWSIDCDDRHHATGPGVGNGSLWLEWLLTAELIRRWETLVHVHAGVVATPACSMLLVGRSGCGKSTTSVALALQGMELYSDDVALIDPGTHRPLCVPRPIKLDTIARRSLRKRGLVVEEKSYIGESIDRTTMPGLPDVGVPGPPVKFVIFFGDRRHAHPEIHPLSRAEAVMRLIVQSSSERFDDSGPSDGAMSIVSGVKCFELVAGDLDSTVTLLKALAETESVSGRAALPSAVH